MSFTQATSTRSSHVSTIALWLTAARSRFTQIVEVHVGGAKTKFYVHPGVICARSPYFEAEVNRWTKAGDPITLTYDEPPAFDLYLRTLYTGSLPVMQCSSLNDFFTKLTGLYIIADRIGDLTIANTTVDKLRKDLWFLLALQSERLATSPSLDVVLELWDSTPIDSPLRQMLVNCYTHKDNAGELCDILKQEEMSKEFAVAIALRLATRATRSAAEQALDDALSAHKCAYHQHDDRHPSCVPAPAISSKTVQQDEE